MTVLSEQSFVDRSRLRRIRPLLTGAGLTAAATLALHFRDPHVSGSWGYCPWLLITGTYCPGCGALRAVNNLTHGDLAAAFSSNALFVLLIPVILGGWALALRRRWTGAVPAQDDARALRWTAVFVVVALGFALIRNLPGFSYLAP